MTTTTDKSKTHYQSGCLTAFRKQRDKLYAELMDDDDIAGNLLDVKALDAAMAGNFKFMDRFREDDCCPECGQTIEDREWRNRAISKFFSVCKSIKEAEHAAYIESFNL